MAKLLQDETFQQWPVNLLNLQPSSSCLMQGLLDFYGRASAGEGDSLSVSSQADGSMLLQLHTEPSIG